MNAPTWVWFLVVLALILLIFMLVGIRVNVE